MTATARSVEGTAAPAESGTISVRDVTLQGGVVLVFDSSMQHAHLVERGLRTGDAAEAGVSRIESETLQLSVGPDAARVTVPAALTLASESRTEGRVQTLHLSGARGELLLNPDPNSGANSLRTGVLVGPIHFALTRDEDGEATKVEGTADRLELDLVSTERTIRMTGNVRITGEGAQYSGETRAASVVVTVDETLRPIRYVFQGAPTETRIRQGGR
jgi:hypothetical protein